MKRGNIIKKFTEMNPWAQSISFLCLLVFLFFLQGITKLSISNKNILLLIVTKTLHYLNNTAALGILFLFTIWAVEFGLLIYRSIKHVPLKRKSILSTPTKYLLGSYVGATCMFFKDSVSELLVRTSFAPFVNGIAWIVLIVGIFIMLLSAVKLMLYCNREVE